MTNDTLDDLAELKCFMQFRYVILKRSSTSGNHVSLASMRAEACTGETCIHDIVYSSGTWDIKVIGGTFIKIIVSKRYVWSILDLFPFSTIDN